MVDREVGTGCFIIGCSLAAAIMLVAVFRNDGEAQIVYPLKAPKPVKFELYRMHDFLIVDQRPKRVAAVKHSAIIAIAVYDAKANLTSGAGWPNVNVTIAGGSFRFDCQTEEDARRFFKYVRDFEDKTETESLPKEYPSE